jgi:hypothetical protein
LSKNQKTCRFYSCQKNRKLVGFSLAKKTQKTCVLLSPKKRKNFYVLLLPKKQKTSGFYSSQKKQKTCGFYSSQKNPENFWVLFSPKTNIGASCFFSVHSTSRSKRLINSELECFLKRSGLMFLFSYKKIENGKNHGKYVGIFYK